MLKAKVENLGVDPTGGQVIVLLRIENGQLLPIWIGPLEAQFIAVAMSGEQPPRPLTPDLTLSIINLLGAKPLRVEISDLSEGTFYARLILSHHEIEYEVDARPSDALALALRCNCPILVDEAVVEAGSVDETRIEPHGEVPEA